MECNQGVDEQATQAEREAPARRLPTRRKLTGGARLGRKAQRQCKLRDGAVGMPEIAGG